MSEFEERLRRIQRGEHVSSPEHEQQMAKIRAENDRRDRELRESEEVRKVGEQKAKAGAETRHVPALLQLLHQAGIPDMLYRIKTTGVLELKASEGRQTAKLSQKALAKDPGVKGPFTEQVASSEARYGSSEEKMWLPTARVGMYLERSKWKYEREERLGTGFGMGESRYGPIKSTTIVRNKFGVWASSSWTHKYAVEGREPNDEDAEAVFGGLGITVVKTPLFRTTPNQITLIRQAAENYFIKEAQRHEISL